MRKIIKTVLFIAGLLTGCSELAQAQFANNPVVKVYDKCNMLLFVDTVSGRKISFDKGSVSIILTNPNQLQAKTNFNQSFICEWDSNTVKVIAPTIQAAIDTFTLYQSYRCVHSTGSGGGGGSGSDSVPIAAGRFLPHVTEFLGIDSLSSDTANWFYYNRLVTVTGTVRMNYDSTLIGGERTYKFAIQMPFISSQFASLSGVIADSFGAVGNISMASFTGLGNFAYARLTHQINFDPVTTYQYTYTYLTDTTIAGFPVSGGGSSMSIAYDQVVYGTGSGVTSIQDVRINSDKSQLQLKNGWSLSFTDETDGTNSTITQPTASNSGSDYGLPLNQPFDNSILSSDATGQWSWVNAVSSGATGTEPSTPYVGQFFFDLTLTKMKFWNGAVWAVLTSTP